MPFYYRIYGLVVESSQRLSYLTKAEATTTPDVRIHFDAWPHPNTAWQPHPAYSSRRPYDQGEEAVLTVAGSPDGAWVSMRYDIGLRGIISADGRTIYVERGGCSLRTATAFVVGPLLGFCLRLQGVTCLHASAVVVEGHAVAICAAPGVGKSTMATTLMQAGYPVLTDDILALRQRDGQWWAAAGYPRLRVVPGKHPPEQTEPMAPEYDKLLLRLGERFHAGAAPLGGIVILHRRFTVLRRPVIERLRGRAALLAVVAHTYQQYMLGPEMRPKELADISAVVTGYPVLKTQTPANLARMAQTAGAIVVELEA